MMLLLCIILIALWPTHSLLVNIHVKASAFRPRGVLHARLNEIEDKADMEVKRGMKGYYRRPSRAIERGGGFFVPGLEGGKIRVVSALILGFLLVLNRYGQVTQTVNQLTSEAVALLCVVVLLVQGVQQEFFPDISFGSDLPKKEKGLITSSQISQTASLYNLRCNLELRSNLDKMAALSEFGGENLEYSNYGFNELVKTMLYTTDGLLYCLVLDKGGNGDKVACATVEYGPIGCKTISDMDAEALFDLSSKTTTSGLQKETFLATVRQFIGKEEVLMHLPASIESLSLIKDASQRTWLLGSYEKEVTLKKQQLWIQQLVSSPLLRA